MIYFSSFNNIVYFVKTYFQHIFKILQVLSLEPPLPLKHLKMNLMVEWPLIDSSGQLFLVP